MPDISTTCYKHPNRETGVSCQRCDRYICTDCATPGAVGFLCPEDAADRVKIRRPAVNQSLTQAAPVTMALIGLNVLVFVGQQLNPELINSLFYANIGSDTEQGSIVRVLTSGFTHSQNQYTHILFNMYSLFVLGTFVEPLVGKLRFIVLYLLSLFGGALGVLFIAPVGTSVVGASGAVFGLMGAYLIFLRALKLNASQMLIIIGINLVVGFLPGIAWEAHVGGLVIGIAVALVLVNTRSQARRTAQILGLVGITVLVFALWIIGNAAVQSLY